MRYVPNHLSVSCSWRWLNYQYFIKMNTFSVILRFGCFCSNVVNMLWAEKYWMCSLPRTTYCVSEKQQQYNQRTTWYIPGTIENVLKGVSYFIFTISESYNVCSTFLFLSRFINFFIFLLSFFIFVTLKVSSIIFHSLIRLKIDVNQETIT